MYFVPFKVTRGEKSDISICNQASKVASTFLACVSFSDFALVFSLMRSTYLTIDVLQELFSLTLIGENLMDPENHHVRQPESIIVR